MTETVLRQVRDRLGPLSGEAEQAVAEALEIVRRMSEPPSSSITEKAETAGFKSENVRLEEYLSWSDDRKEQYQSDAEEANAKWIERKMHELNAMWLIVIDGEIIASGPLLRTFPHDEDFDKLCENTGKYPFVLFSPRMFYIEETAAWHATTHPDDAYPTVRINIKADAGETELEADFDTGALDTYLDLDLLVRRGVITAMPQRPRRKSAHLGQKFSYIAKSIWLELNDKNGQRRPTRTVVLFVSNWRKSPFVAVNPKRTALVGRVTMLQLQPIVVLDFAKRQTEVEYPTSS